MWEDVALGKCEGNSVFGSQHMEAFYVCSSHVLDNQAAVQVPLLHPALQSRSLRKVNFIRR
jgi:hypothetical protein